jgi:hypothetical protein
MTVGSRVIAAPRRALGQAARAARERRNLLLVDRFPHLPDMRVVDLGGTPDWWRGSGLRPASVTVVNIRPDEADEDWITYVEGDACDPPPHLFEEPFDLVFSNSLIEHVGGHFRRQQFADVVHRLAPRHWVQTPYRYFPIEPHWMFPGFQFLPVAARREVTRRWGLGHVTPAGGDRRRATESVLTVELLSLSEFRYYFPGSEILRERAAGLVKGMTAVRCD